MVKGIKKIMSVIASVAMIGSTAIFASAASTSGILGSNTVLNAPGPLDAPAASSIASYISSLNINQTVTTNETIINGEMSAVRTSSQPLYLGDDMSITKSVFTESQLPNVLASGEVTGDDGKNYEYNLKIDIPNVVTKYGEPDNLDKAIIYSDFSNDESYKLRIIFPTAVDVKELAGETINLFGKDYTFSEDESDLSNESITLFEKSNSVKINNGETITVNGYEIKADIEDSDSATLYVGGVSKSVSDNDWSGKINGVNIYVKNIVASNIEGGVRYIQISLNSEKLVLNNGDEVELGTNSLDGTNVIISPSGEKVREITIEVIPNNAEINEEDNLEYIEIGKYFIDPVFKTIKFSLDSVTPDLKSEDRDYIKLKKSGDKGAVLEFTNKAGKDYTFTFIDNGNLNFLMSKIQEDDYFITGSNEYSQVWKLEDIKGTESVKLRDQGSNSNTLTLSIDGSGNAELPLADGSSATISFSDSTKSSIKISSSKIQNFVYTKNGAKINLNDKYNWNTIESTGVPDDITTIGVYENQTIVNHLIPMNVSIEEETLYNNGDFKNNSGNNLGRVIDIEVTSPTSDLGLSLLGTYDYSYAKDDNIEVVTKYGTYIKESDDSDKLEIYYPGEAMKIDFNIGEVTSSITTNTQTVVTEGSISKIILGGTCVNGEASRLLGVGQLCGADFTAATGVGAGQVLMKTFAEADGKIAVLIAGYETADTLRGAEYLKTNSAEFNSAGVSKVI